MPSSTRSYLDRLRQHYDRADADLPWSAREYRRWLAHYYNLLIPENAKVIEIGCGSGDLLALLKTRNVTGLDLSENQISRARVKVPYGHFHVAVAEELSLTETYDYILVSDTLNLAGDVQLLLSRLHQISHPGTRLLINITSSLWRPVYRMATALGLRPPHPEQNWLATSDLKNLLSLSQWETIKTTGRILMPCGFLGLDGSVNRWLAPIVPALGLSVFCVARPQSREPQAPMRVSVIIPARNERDNIAEAVRRVPDMGLGTEILFVEGHSKDGTWEEIQRVQQSHPERSIKILRQPGRGKGDAVRAAFDEATGDVFMILDADLTVAPEELPKFYAALEQGQAEFANGVRLVYPMEKHAMRFLNLCANKFFSLAFSWLLGQSIKDTLCGTKVLRASAYRKIAANRAYFGDFDPFGDFDLLFGADKQNLKIRDVPVRYWDRTYGETNIRRWRDGALLFRMMAFAARKLKFI